MRPIAGYLYDRYGFHRTYTTYTVIQIFVSFFFLEAAKNKITYAVAVFVTYGIAGSTITTMAAHGI
jgi:multidrug transporter EmrE-like cation transporter